MTVVSDEAVDRCPRPIGRGRPFPLFRRHGKLTVTNLGSKAGDGPAPSTSLDNDRVVLRCVNVWSTQSAECSFDHTARRMSGSGIAIVTSEGQMEERWNVESSPVHQAMWKHGGVEPFDTSPLELSDPVRGAMDRSLSVVRRHKQAGSRYGADRSVAPALVADLAEAGYWGMRASPAYGGAGASFRALAQFITEMAVADPWVAGMMSVQACIGPVGLLEAFGTAEQKERLLRPLATGQRLGAFAVTEPSTATDWGAIRTVARSEGDWLSVSGEKLFITNAGLGRTVGTLCLINGRHEMVLIELPEREDEHFRIATSGLKAPAHIRNVGLVFDNLQVPAANVLHPIRGDGRSLAYHALNHGRVAVCANAAGQLRIIAGSLIPWVQQRQTFGAPIGARELVQRRLGWLAGRVVACDAMTAWTAHLLDEGYRGELECVTAKIFGSESVTEACVDVLLKTLGSRAFLEGNPFSEWLFDLLAPTVYEGENEVLTLGYFHSLAREHGEHYLAPIAAAITERPHEGAAGHHPSVSDILAAGGHATSYAAWLVGEEVRHAIGRFQHQLSADPAELSGVAHELLPAMAQDPLIRQAGICAALELGTRLTDSRPTAQTYELVTELGRAVAEDRFAPVRGADRVAVRMTESTVA